MSGREAAATMVSETQLRDVLASTAFTAAYGFALDGFGRGWCAIRVPFTPVFRRPGGIVSGQAYMAAADVAAWFAIKTLAGIDDPSVTIEMTTSFLAALRDADFICRAEVLQAGATATFVTARCTAADGRVLTHHTVRYLRPAGGSR